MQIKDSKRYTWQTRFGLEAKRSQEYHTGKNIAQFDARVSEVSSFLSLAGSVNCTPVCVETEE